MGYIKQLSEDLIKKIAAGEVIEIFAAAFDEMVENATESETSESSVPARKSDGDEKL